ncbi:insulinase family protein [Altererythrobacter aquiaggeris]|uniref:M16 family metallopeptidase n=1 Tax=Aestuarierythrobacter aquiaggeris TaxID=1898396 RepID=UPI00301640DD
MRIFIGLASLALAGCASVSAPETMQSAALPPAAVWGIEQTDIPLDPAYVLGTLPNGMRYAIRQNSTPEGTALVRMAVDSGSLSETDAERGYAHFVEHMAFNGSSRVPEGEMIKLLEREGLAFGADTNASTGFEQTLYKLDLPRNDPALLDTALMLMRETASELIIADEAVERERGIILSELRDRTTYGLKETVDRMKFLTPDARYSDRLPIGTADTLAKANGENLRVFYEREYVPANTALVVVGDFEPAEVKAAIEKHFASWAPAPLPTTPLAGPIDTARAGVTDIYLDPSLSERVTASRIGAWIEEPDTVAARKERLLERVGYAIVNRRFQRAARGDNAPFRGAGFGTGDIFDEGRTTNLIVDAGDGEWDTAFRKAVEIWNRALTGGFTQDEVTEQLSAIRTQVENGVSGAPTRSHGVFAEAVLRMLDEGIIPTTPESGQIRFENAAADVNPQTVLAALKRHAVTLDDPLIRFYGRLAPEGGADALRLAWREALAKPAVTAPEAAIAEFGYTGFGTPGRAVTDETDSRLGIRMLTFTNGLKLNLKRTDLQADRISFRLHIDGGTMLDTKDAPLATALTGSLAVGGLGKHSEDELQSILAGRSVGWSIGAASETFLIGGGTTKRDLDLQMRLLAAAITDPGYREQGEVQYRRNIANFFANLNATPGSAMRNALGGIVSDNDPRFTLQPLDDYRALSFARLRAAIEGRLDNGAMELSVVGDFDEDEMIELAAKTLGALPAREIDFRPYDDRRQRSFTQDRSQRILRHAGEADQALLYLTWPTRDDSDLKEVLELEVLERVMRLQLTDSLREVLGQAYSPGASNRSSGTYEGYGTFAVSASIDVADVAAAREAMAAVVEKLRREAISDDTLERARRPMIENYDNALKSNSGWMSLVDLAQSQPDTRDRFLLQRGLLETITPEDIRQMAARYIAIEQALEILTLPEAK